MFAALEFMHERPAPFQHYTVRELWADEHPSSRNTFKYEAEKVVLDKYTIVEPERTRTVYNWLQYFTPDEVEREFSASGFRVEERYGDVAGAPYDPTSTEFAVVAVRE